MTFVGKHDSKLNISSTGKTKRFRDGMTQKRHYYSKISPKRSQFVRSKSGLISSEGGLTRELARDKHSLQYIVA